MFARFELQYILPLFMYSFVLTFLTKGKLFHHSVGWITDKLVFQGVKMVANI